MGGGYILEGTRKKVTVMLLLLWTQLNRCGCTRTELSIRWLTIAMLSSKYPFPGIGVVNRR